MVKWIIRISLIYIVITAFSLFYLSFYGLETDYFNSTIQKKIRSFDRQALHAKYLEFFHPRNGNIVKYQANQPEDLKNLIDILKKLSKT